jgi:peptidoglycan/xylan/chitin deacetylase (PgdA/CDA1 family)
MAVAEAMTPLGATTLRGATCRMLHAVPVPVWRRVFPKPALGVCYHMISAVPVPHLRHYPFLDPAGFAADLTYLQHNFELLSYAQLSARSHAAQRRRRNELVLTFDDGFSQCASVAAPILRRHGAPAVFFVITDLIDNAACFRETAASLCIGAILAMPTQDVQAIMRELDLARHLAPPPDRPVADFICLPLEVSGIGSRAATALRPLLHWLLTLDARHEAMLGRLAERLGVDPQDYVRRVQPYLTTAQIRQLHAEGFTIGAHGRSHRWLQDLPRAEAEHEIVDACRIVRGITGQDEVPFAFPYFGGGLDRAWLAGLREQHDFIGLFFDTDGLREDEPFVVQRVFGERFGQDSTLDEILRRAWARPAAWRKAK